MVRSLVVVGIVATVTVRVCGGCVSNVAIGTLSAGVATRQFKPGSIGVIEQRRDPVCGIMTGFAGI